MSYLFYCPQMAEIARSIAAAVPGIRLGRIDWRDFEDGFPNLKIHDAELLRNAGVFFLAAFDSPGEIFKQLSVIYDLPRLSIRDLTVILPFYPTGTMERVEQEGEIATAATLARMLSATPLSKSGPLQVIVYDIHALSERFYFSDRVIPRLESAMAILKERIKTMDNMAIAFPDEGAWKRFRGMLGEYPIIICHKVRMDKDRIITIKEGDPAGKHVIIVDDLIMTGGTILQCKKALSDHGARRVSAYATHGVFPGDSWNRFINAGFHKLWITDSCPRQAARLSVVAPFEILSLAPAISEIIKKEG
ncbi:MAG: ribose-phosphate diphosphokinase [Desulfobacteraceae bacterium]|nr:ribose-phosphate diphosphokinase [Desulfobacteraceae bacterium]